MGGVAPRCGGVVGLAFGEHIDWHAKSQKLQAQFLVPMVIRAQNRGSLKESSFVSVSTPSFSPADS
jgi:hypothetical protein